MCAICTIWVDVETKQGKSVDRFREGRECSIQSFWGGYRHIMCSDAAVGGLILEDYRSWPGHDLFSSS